MRNGRAPQNPTSHGKRRDLNVAHERCVSLLRSENSLISFLKFPDHEKEFPVPFPREFREKAQHFRGLVGCHQPQNGLKRVRFPVISLFNREFGRGDRFAVDCVIRQRVIANRCSVDRDDDRAPKLAAAFLQKCGVRLHQDTPIRFPKNEPDVKRFIMSVDHRQMCRCGEGEGTDPARIDCAGRIFP